MAVNGVGNTAINYIQQNNLARDKATDLDLARMRSQGDSLKKVVEHSFKIQAEQSRMVNEIKEAALEINQSGNRIDTWA